jgi:Uma2 family endonuclease
MATAPPDRLLTAEDLTELPDDGCRYELVKGRLVRMPPAASASSLVAMILGWRVMSFVRQHALGSCLGADGGVRLGSNPDTVRAPDFAFFSQARLPGGVPPSGYLGAPDLAVEVLSPTDRFGDVLVKVAEYLAAGVRLVWVIDYRSRSAFVFRPDRGYDTLTGDAQLDGEDVLPGFRLPLSVLWEGLAEEEPAGG